MCEVNSNRAAHLHAYQHNICTWAYFYVAYKTRRHLIQHLTAIIIIFTASSREYFSIFLALLVQAKALHMLSDVIRLNVKFTGARRQLITKATLRRDALSHPSTPTPIACNWNSILTILVQIFIVSHENTHNLHSNHNKCIVTFHES